MTREVQTRNAEATRERILEAAMAEFSAYGVAGARVDRIATSAGCNKNLIYVYFDNKETLFTTVLQKHLVRVYDDLEFTPDDLPGYAVRVFDFAVENPDLMRLLAWSSLDLTAKSPVERSISHDSKVAAIEKSQQAGDVGTAFPPSFLLTTIMTLATAWSAANPFGPLDAETPNRPASLRANIAAAIELMVASPSQG
jgi:AcrR family transcriptional regulator